MAGARGLTIGEAAACLSADFPGVTATVLRRLESAGKFTAARTGSGYRRYSQSDLELLKIVLSGSAAAGSDPDPSDLSGAESPLTHPAAGAASQGTDLDAAGSGALRRGHDSEDSDGSDGAALPGRTRRSRPEPDGAADAQRPAAARTAARTPRAASSRVPAARGSGSSRTQAPAIAALFDVPPGGSGGHTGIGSGTGTGYSEGNDGGKGHGTGAGSGNGSSTGIGTGAGFSDGSGNSHVTGSGSGNAPSSAHVPSQYSVGIPAAAQPSASGALTAPAAAPVPAARAGRVSVGTHATEDGTVPAARAGAGRTTRLAAEPSQRPESPAAAREAVATVLAPPVPGQAPSRTVPGSASLGYAPGSARTVPAPGSGTSSSAPGSASPTPTRRADRRWPDAEFFTPDLGEVSLDLDQLAAAARTDRAWVDGLVEYGVLPSSDSAGGADLLVARASAELAQFGVEPRHLRAVAASAARVAELIAAATATGAARDPARRERTLLAAPGRSAEAAAAAVRLHAALVRAALLRG